MPLKRVAVMSVLLLTAAGARPASAQEQSWIDFDRGADVKTLVAAARQRTAGEPAAAAVPVKTFLGPWRRIAASSSTRYLNDPLAAPFIKEADQYCFYSLDVDAMRELLRRAPEPGSRKPPIVVMLPLSDGDAMAFTGVQNQLFEGNDPPETLQGAAVGAPAVTARYSMLDGRFTATIHGDFSNRPQEQTTGFISIPGVYLTVRYGDPSAAPRKLYCR